MLPGLLVDFFQLHEDIFDLERFGDECVLDKGQQKGAQID